MHAPGERHNIQVLKAAHPLPQVAARYGLELRPSGQGLVGLCPFHEDHNPSFSIYLTTGGEWRFRCFGASCGQSGDLIDFIGLQLHGPNWDSGNRAQFKQVLDALGAQDSPTPRRNGNRSSWAHLDTQPRAKQRVTPLIQLAWDVALGLYGDVLARSPEAQAYLRGRGFNQATLRRYRFGYCPPEGANLTALARLLHLEDETLEQASLLRRPVGRARPRWVEFLRGRIVFADINLGRQTLYLLGRRPPHNRSARRAPKYLGLANFAKPVLGAASLTPSKDPVLVVEGPWDMLTLRQWGYAAVAIAGAHMSQAQVDSLLRLERRLVPIQENDAGGQLAYHAWRESLPGLESPLRLPEKVGTVSIKDPNDLAAKLPEDEGRKLFDDLAKRKGVSARR